MTKRISRRDFVRTSATLGALAAAPRGLAAGPSVLVKAPTRAVVIASVNGNKFTNGGPRTCVAEAFERMSQGSDVLDALIAGVNVVELDPADDSVGYGGLPNADGVVQLDSSCMHGPLKRAGGVAALEGVRTPSLVARAVMDQTDHHLLAGAGAQVLARNLGFPIESDLNTPHSRALWLEWKRRVDPGHYPDPAKRAAAGDAARRAMLAEGLLDPLKIWGTLNCNGVSAKGEVCGVTTTSGLAWKIPGRVGDSPILGAGLWVDNEIGAAGSTGRGEANLFSLSSFYIVEQMRQGRHPKDAAIAALERIKAATIEPRLLNSQGLPDFVVKFYVLNKKGDFAGVSLYARVGGKPVQFAVCTDRGPQTLDCDSLLGEMPEK